MTTEQLADTFKSCGTIVDSIVKMDGRTGRSRGFGVVEFSDPKEAEKAIDEFHNKNIGSGDGRPLVVRYDREGNRGGAGFGGGARRRAERLRARGDRRPRPQPARFQ